MKKHNIAECKYPKNIDTKAVVSSAAEQLSPARLTVSDLLDAEPDHDHQQAEADVVVDV